MPLEKIKHLLEENHADFDIISHEKPIISRNDAVAYFKLEEMAPTLILKSKNSYFALIISGKRAKLNLKFIQEKLMCKELKLAGKQEIREKLELEAGRIPLVGHSLPCIFDEALFGYDYVYGGSGDFLHTLKINPKDLFSINKTILKINFD